MSEQKFFTFKDLPLVRNGKTIYFGNMTDKYVTMLNIMSTHKVNDLEVADKVKVTLMVTDPDVPANEAIQKTSDRGSLYEALDVAYIWLSSKNAKA